MTFDVCFEISIKFVKIPLRHHYGCASLPLVYIEKYYLEQHVWSLLRLLCSNSHRIHLMNQPGNLKSTSNMYIRASDSTTTRTMSHSCTRNIDVRASVRGPYNLKQCFYNLLPQTPQMCHFEKKRRLLHVPPYKSSVAICLGFRACPIIQNNAYIHLHPNPNTTDMLFQKDAKTAACPTLQIICSDTYVLPCIICTVQNNAYLYISSTPSTISVLFQKDDDLLPMSHHPSAPYQYFLFMTPMLSKHASQRL